VAHTKISWPSTASMGALLQWRVFRCGLREFDGNHFVWTRNLALVRVLYGENSELNWSVAWCRPWWRAKRLENTIINIVSPNLINYWKPNFLDFVCGSSSVLYMPVTKCYYNCSLMYGCRRQSIFTLRLNNTPVHLCVGQFDEFKGT
jgi:hypothetical protein